MSGEGSTAPAGSASGAAAKKDWVEELFEPGVGSGAIQTLQYAIAGVLVLTVPSYFLLPEDMAYHAVVMAILAILVLVGIHWYVMQSFIHSFIHSLLIYLYLSTIALFFFV